MSDIKEFNLEKFDPKDNNLVLEASAGTGKTYSVTEIVEKLLGDKSTSKEKKKELLRKILIVTYTDKATGELKDRIRTKLSKSGCNFDENDYNIFTIHSFCQNAIKEFGFNANLPLGLDIINEDVYLDKYIDEYLRSEGVIDKVAKIICDYKPKKKDDKITLDDFKKMFIGVLKDYYLKKDNSIDSDVISIFGVEHNKSASSLDEYDALDVNTFDEVIDKLLTSEEKEILDATIKNDIKIEKIINDLAYAFKNNKEPNDFKPIAKWPEDNDLYEAISFFKDNYKTFDELLKNNDFISKKYELLDKSGDPRCSELARIIKDTYSNSNGKISIKIKKEFNNIEQWPKKADEYKALQFFHEIYKEKKNIVDIKSEVDKNKGILEGSSDAKCQEFVKYIQPQLDKGKTIKIKKEYEYIEQWPKKADEYDAVKYFVDNPNLETFKSLIIHDSNAKKKHDCLNAAGDTNPIYKEILNFIDNNYENGTNKKCDVTINVIEQWPKEADEYKAVKYFTDNCSKEYEGKSFDENTDQEFKDNYDILEKSDDFECNILADAIKNNYSNGKINSLNINYKIVEQWPKDNDDFEAMKYFNELPSQSTDQFDDLLSLNPGAKEKYDILLRSTDIKCQIYAKYINLFYRKGKFPKTIEFSSIIKKADLNNDELKAAQFFCERNGFKYIGDSLSDIADEDFISNYRTLKESSKPKCNLLANIIEAKYKNGTISISKFDCSAIEQWPKDNDVFEAMKYFQSEIVCYPVDDFDDLLSLNPGAKENYDRLLRSTDLKCQIYAKYIKKYYTKGKIPNPKVEIKVVEQCPKCGTEFKAAQYFIDNNMDYGVDSFNSLLTEYPKLKQYYNDLNSNTASEEAKKIAMIIKESFKDGRITGVYKDKNKFSLSFDLIEKWPDNDNVIPIIEKLVKVVKRKSKNKIEIEKFVVENIDEVYESWQEKKLSNKKQAFSDMIRSVREEIISGNGNFKKALQDKYTYAIIDEFQDTNKLQFDIFKAIFMEDNEHHIIVVGDPKQSIYAFQGADLNVYYKAKEEIEKLGVVEKLGTNWRSTYRMVNSCNLMFNNGFFSDEKISFSDSKPCGEGRDAIYNGNTDTKAIWIGYENKDDNDRKKAKKDKINHTGIDEYDYANYAVKHIIEFTTIDKNNKTKLQLTPYKFKSNNFDDLLATAPEEENDFKDYYDCLNDSSNEKCKQLAKYIREKYNDCMIPLIRDFEYYSELEEELKGSKLEKEHDAIKYFKGMSEWKNVSFKDFAILARTRSEFEPIERELKYYGIPYIKYKDTNLFSDRECAHWIALFEAINVVDFTGNNRGFFRKALFTDFFNKTLKEINSELYDRDDSKEMESILSWKYIAKDREWETLVDKIIEDSGILDRLSSLDKLQSVSIYKQIGDYCVSYLYNNHTIDDLIDNLKKLSEGDSDEQDTNTVEIGTDFDAVKLLTIHASKGLQFPIVISVAGFKGKNKQAKVCTFHDKKDSNKRKISFDLSDADNDIKLEWERLLYVAYTRAKYLLFIPYYGPNSDIYRNVAANRILNYKMSHTDDYETIKDIKETDDNLKQNVKETLKSLVKETTSSSEEQMKKQIEEIRKKLTYVTLNNKKSFKHAYTSLTHPNNDKDRNDDSENTTFESVSEYDENCVPCKCLNYQRDELSPIIPDKFPKGTKIGSALHEIFEKAVFVEYKEKEFDKNGNLDGIISDAMKNNKCTIDLNDSKTKNYIRDMVLNVLNADLAEIKGNLISKVNKYKLSSIPEEDRKAEMEFNFNVQDEKLKNYLNGFIDLIYKRGDYFSVLDWKSDTLKLDEIPEDKDSGIDSEKLKDKNIYSIYDLLKNHTDDHYSIQRVLYSYCVIKWLNKMYGEASLDETFNKHFGGVYYVYIRGCKSNTGNGIYCQTWDNFNTLKVAYEKIINDRIKNKKGDNRND